MLDSLRSELYEHNVTVTNIMPGYVRTNLSKNALSAGLGQKLGFTDKNIQNGVSPEKFASQAVKAIYNKENQLQISDKLAIPFGIFIRNLCPDLLFYMMRKDAKNQAEAIKRSAQ